MWTARYQRGERREVEVEARDYSQGRLAAVETPAE
jgi:hypothetical protein